MTKLEKEKLKEILKEENSILCFDLILYEEENLELGQVINIQKDQAEHEDHIRVFKSREHNQKNRKHKIRQSVKILKESNHQIENLNIDQLIYY
jgi:hypothetical protein